MKLRLANKIFDSCGTEREYNSYKMDKAKIVISRQFENYLKKKQLEKYI